MYQLTYNLYKIRKGRPLDHDFLSTGQRRRAGVADIVPTGWLQLYLALGFAGQWHLTQSANPPGSPSTKCSNDIQQPPPSVRLGVIAAWCNRFSHPVCQIADMATPVYCDVSPTCIRCCCCHPCGHHQRQPLPEQKSALVFLMRSIY